MTVQAARSRKDLVVSTTNLPQKQTPGKGSARHSLSSGAYFDSRYESTHLPRTTSDEITLERNMQRVTSAQSRRIRHAKPNKITVYADMVKVSMPDELNGKRDRKPDHFGGIRGDIVGFSRASRKRMIEFMAKVRDVGDMYFVTMTYDDMSWLVKSDAHQDDFEAFRHRFERAFPNWKALWRVEVKERLSGLLQGSKVPHFHLLIFTGRNDSDEDKSAYAQGLQAWGTRVWGSILQAENPHFSHYGFHVSAVKSRKHAYSYVSKYIGKSDEDDISCGRRWGRIGGFDTSYSEIVYLSDDEATYFRRLVKRWLKSKKSKFVRKFTRQNRSLGYSIFGLGDTSQNGQSCGIFAPYSQFIVEVRRWSHEIGERERTFYGD